MAKNIRSECSRAHDRLSSVFKRHYRPAKRYLAPELALASETVAHRCTSGVRITHANIVANVCQMAYHFGQIADQKLKEGTYARTAGVLQNSVAAGVLVHTMMSVHTGMQVYLMRKYDYALLKKCIRHFSISALFLAPVIWKRIADDCQPDDLSSIRFAMSGAAPLSPDLQRKTTALLPDGVGLRVNWGMTETSCGATQFGPGELDTESSVGRLLPAMEMVILGPNAKKLGPDQEGDLCIRGEPVRSVPPCFEIPNSFPKAQTSSGNILRIPKPPRMRIRLTAGSVPEMSARYQRVGRSF